MKISVLLVFAIAFLGSCKTNNPPASSCINPEKINPDAMCIQIYDPVCGCDGKTYSNSCYADIAGVTSYTKGECR